MIATLEIFATVEVTDCDGAQERVREEIAAAIEHAASDIRGGTTYGGIFYEDGSQLGTVSLRFTEGTQE